MTTLFKFIYIFKMLIHDNVKKEMKKKLANFESNHYDFALIVNESQ